MCVIRDYLGKNSLNENQIGIDGSVRLCHLKFIIEDETKKAWPISLGDCVSAASKGNSSSP